MRERGDGVRALHQARVLEQRDAPVSVPRSEEVAALLRSTVAGSTVSPSLSAASPADLDHAPCTGHPRRHVHVAHLTFLSWEGGSNAVPSPCRSTYACARRRRHLYAATLMCAPGGQPRKS